MNSSFRSQAAFTFGIGEELPFEIGSIRCYTRLAIAPPAGVAASEGRGRTSLKSNLGFSEIERLSVSLDNSQAALTVPDSSYSLHCAITLEFSGHGLVTTKNLAHVVLPLETRQVGITLLELTHSTHRGRDKAGKPSQEFKTVLTAKLDVTYDGNTQTVIANRIDVPRQSEDSSAD